MRPAHPPPPESASGHAAQRADRGGASCGAGPRRAGFPGGGALVRPVRRPELPPRSSERAASGHRAPPVPSRAMLPWTALGLALSLRLALARSGAERGECGAARGRAPAPPADPAARARPALLSGGGGWAAARRAPHPPVAGGPRCPKRLDQARGRGGSRLPPSASPQHRGAWTGGEGVRRGGGPYLRFPLLGMSLRRGMTGRLELPHWIGENQGLKAQTRIETPQCMARGAGTHPDPPPPLGGTGQEGGGPGGGGPTLSLLHQVPCFLGPDGAEDGGPGRDDIIHTGLRLQPGHLGCGRGLSAVSPTRRPVPAAASHPLPHVHLSPYLEAGLCGRSPGWGSSPSRPSGSTCHSCRWSGPLAQPVCQLLRRECGDSRG